jgi:Helix-turn-helix of DDE superfamily endonuclease
MLDIIEVKGNKRDFLALTGLTLKEFKLILPCFRKIYEKRYEGEQTLAGELRQRKIGGGRSSVLDRIEQKLFFILVYQKTYPVQVIVAKLFDLSQSRANQWIHRLLPVLKDALDELGVMPERDGTKFAADERKRGAAAAYVIDGTERRRNRPKSPEKQALHYSGKKKQHTDKNIVVTDAKSGRQKTGRA